MIAISLLLVRVLFDFFKPRPRLEAEILSLRHQLNVLQQRTPRRRLHLRWVDRAHSNPSVSVDGRRQSSSRPPFCRPILRA
jgi:hypothetical protein